MSKKQVEIFTDGSCLGNPGPGGWAALLKYQSAERLISGAVEHTTNNRMELTAAIEALAALNTSCKIDLTTDSQYVRLGITEWLPKWKKNNWRTANKKEVKNSDLWQQLEVLVEKHEICWHWVKGHAGHPENELVDKAARDAITQLEQK